jgi:hypothetical protein
MEIPYFDKVLSGFLNFKLIAQIGMREPLRLISFPLKQLLKVNQHCKDIAKKEPSIATVKTKSLLPGTAG